MLEIIEIGADRLGEVNLIPSRFVVRTFLEPTLIENGLGGMRLVEQPVAEPYLKDYDRYGEVPSDWALKFDVRAWGFFLAVRDGKNVGAASVAFDTPGVNMLEERRDLAVLWDLRVAPAGRGAGILLWRAAARWARTRGCAQMKVETQNVNVPACRFYERMGARLGEIRRFGYAGVPSVAHEVMLCWYLDLTREYN